MQGGPFLSIVFYRYQFLSMRSNFFFFFPASFVFLVLPFCFVLFLSKFIFVRLLILF